MTTPTEPIHIISLGAGVQSSTMALMAAKGEIGPMPVAAVFADTGDEPRAVYEWLDWLELQLPFPVIRRDNGISLSQHVFNAIDRQERVSNPPPVHDSHSLRWHFLQRMRDRIRKRSVPL